MALLTSQTNMATREREVAQVMIESGILPIGRRMTCSTIGTVFAFVFIVPFMAGVTVYGSTYKGTILVARFAFHLRVLTLQFEHG